MFLKKSTGMSEVAELEEKPNLVRVRAQCTECAPDIIGHVKVGRSLLVCEDRG